MQDGESGARHIGAATQTRDETFDEYRFTSSQVSLECQNRRPADFFCKLPPYRFRFSRAIGNERSHGAIFDRRFSIVD